jgi:hypothetical protein
MLRKLAVSAALIGTISTAGLAQSEVTERPPEDRWIPSLEGSLLLVDYNAAGSIESGVGQSGAGRAKAGTPTFQLGVNLMSPRLGLPLSPRIVGFAGALVGPDQTIQIVNEGEFREGQPEAGVEDQLPPEQLLGQGSELLGTRQNVGWYMGLGISFDVPKSGSRFRLKPLVGYFGESAEVEGRVVSVTGPPSAYQIHRPEASADVISHFIGPGLEGEVILGRNDKFAVGLFAQLYYVWKVGERATQFSDPDNSVLFWYDPQVNGFRGGAGVRFSWESLFR